MAITVERAREVVTFNPKLALKAEHDRAVLALEDAQRGVDPNRENTSRAVRDAAKRVQALEQQIRDADLLFTVEAVPRKEFGEFEAAHPPRKGNDVDEMLSVDVSALDPLIVRSIVSVTTRDGDPVAFDPATEWDTLAEGMSDGQWQDFATAVLRVNRGVKGAPFSLAASAATRPSARTSN